MESLMVIYDATIIAYQDLYLKTGTSPLACPGFYIHLIEYNLRSSLLIPFISFITLAFFLDFTLS